jgi:hypothetical protein
VNGSCYSFYGVSVPGWFLLRIALWGRFKGLAAELGKIYGELGGAMRREKEAGNMTEVDGDKIVRMTEVLHKKIYGEYTEFEEERMNSSNLSEDMRLIEKLHQELDEERRFREEERRSREAAISKAVELEQSREKERQRFRDTARNILRLGLPVEQVAQATGLPLETVQALAARL